MDTFLSQPTEHNHVPIPERVGAIQLTNQVKIRAQTSEKTNQHHFAFRFKNITFIGSE